MPLAPGRYVRRALDYLDTHYAKPLEVRDIAQVVGVSSSHLAHLFRAEVGMTVHAHLTKLRVDAAKVQLGLGDAKLHHIAHQVGFCDASHLARAFQRLTGERPSSFRRPTSAVS